MLQTKIVHPRKLPNLKEQIRDGPNLKFVAMPSESINQDGGEIMGFSRNIGSIAGAILIVALVFCCTEKANVHIEIRAASNVDEPIGSASVIINGLKVGETDATGKFSTDDLFPAQSSLAIRVEKNSVNSYISPYFEKIWISKHEAQRVSVNATLFSVPKSHFATGDGPISPPSEDTVKPKLESPISNESSKSTNLLPAVREIDTTSNKVEEVASAASVSAQQAKEIDTPPSTEHRLSESAETNPEPTILMNSKMSSPNNTGPNALIVPVKSQGPADGPALPLVAPPFEATENYLLYSIYTYSSDKPIDSVAIYYGDETKGSLKEGCKTNGRGRCNLHLTPTQAEFMTFVAKKDGYRTASIKRHLAKNGDLQFQLIPGQTVDVFALTQRYNYIQGIEDIEVKVDDKKVGKTDKFGHFPYFYMGKDGDKLAISLVSTHHIPNVYQLEFVVSGSTSLVHHFTPASPPKAKIAITDINIINDTMRQDINNMPERLTPWLHSALKQDLFETYPFEEVATSQVNKLISSLKTSIDDLASTGWGTTPLKSIIDAIIVPTLIVSDQWILELSLINSKGLVISAAKERLANDINRDDIRRATQVIAGNLAKKFPFEGSVIGKDEKYFIVNLGTGTGHSVKDGDLLNIYTNESDTLDARNHRKIGWAEIVGVSDLSSKIKIGALKPGSEINIGDIVELRGPNDGPADMLRLKVADNSPNAIKPIAQANVYIGEGWIGSTDKNGLLEIKKSLMSGSNQLKIIKRGYHSFGKEFSSYSNTNLEIELTQEMALFRLETSPSGAKIYIDGKQLGNSPIVSSVAASSNLVKLEIRDVNGYKPFSAVFELKNGALDLTGAHKISLEKDLLADVKVLLNLGKVTQAIDKINQISPTHSDYLMSQNQLGEIYLTMLKKPALAAKSFHNITKNPAVAAFIDKRFIGSFVNEGLALFQTADNLQNAGELEAAKAHYKEALKVFSNVAPHVGLLPADQNERIVRSISFHRALALQRLWSSTAEESYRISALKYWEDYIGTSGTQPNADETDIQYLEAAKTYQKQLARTAKRRDNSGTL